MTPPDAVESPLQRQPPQEPSPLRRAVLHKLVATSVLTMLSMIGLFWINYRPQDAFWYWAAMFPAFGVVSTWQAVVSRPNAAQSLAAVLGRQALHWLGPIVALWVLFLQLERGQMDADAVGLMSMLVLAVTSYLAGVHFDFGFMWVGAVLVVGVLVATQIEAYFWLLAALVVLALVVAAIAARLLRKDA